MPHMVMLYDGKTKSVDVHENGWLEVKSHTPDECFHVDYAGAQTNQVILTPTSGKKLRITQAGVSTAVNNVDVILKFTTSGDIFFKLYTAQKGAHTSPIICAEGDTDETVSLTCGAGTFVSIGYDEID